MADGKSVVLDDLMRGTVDEGVTRMRSRAEGSDPVMALSASLVAALFEPTMRTVSAHGAGARAEDVMVGSIGGLHNLALALWLNVVMALKRDGVGEAECRELFGAFLDSYHETAGDMRGPSFEALERSLAMESGGR
ncbi:hypothetical protein sos41_11670 [Alphaproteobacteria bacterium SO-S41]|nr:hypothetical protein sos41_11670 [Alphaproteobacteria bacterium SO-S41]